MSAVRYVCGAPSSASSDAFHTRVPCPMDSVVLLFLAYGLNMQTLIDFIALSYPATAVSNLCSNSP